MSQCHFSEPSILHSEKAIRIVSRAKVFFIARILPYGSVTFPHSGRRYLMTLPGNTVHVLRSRLPVLRKVVATCLICESFPLPKYKIVPHAMLASMPRRLSSGVTGSKRSTRTRDSFVGPPVVPIGQCPCKT